MRSASAEILDRGGLAGPVGYSQSFVHRASSHPVSPTQNSGVTGMPSSGAYARKFRRSDRKMFRNVDTASLCKDALLNAYGDEKSVHKAIAEDTGMSPAAAENWTAGDNPMSLTAFLNAYHNNPAFKAWARKLLLMEQDIDPRFQVALTEFVRAVQTQEPGFSTYVRDRKAPEP